MKTPDVTPAEVVALVAGALAVAAAFGLPVTPEQSNALQAFTGLLAAFVLGNAHVRNGRSKIAAVQAARDAAAELASENDSTTAGGE